MYIETPFFVKESISLKNIKTSVFYQTKLNHEEFDNSFTLLSKSLYPAKDIFSPSVIKNLLEFNKEFTDEFNLLFLENKMYIFVPNFTIFEIEKNAILKEITKEDINLTLNTIKNSIEIFYKLIDCFEMKNKNQEELPPIGKLDLKKEIPANTEFKLNLEKEEISIKEENKINTDELYEAEFVEKSFFKIPHIKKILFGCVIGIGVMIYLSIKYADYDFIFRKYPITQTLYENKEQPESSYQLGLFYLNTIKDNEKAKYWFLKSFESGSGLSAIELGKMDWEYKDEWFKKAEEKSGNIAKYEIANYYEIANDFENAMFYYNKILNSGDKNALDKIASLYIKKLTLLYKETTNKLSVDEIKKIINFFDEASKNGHKYDSFEYALGNYYEKTLNDRNQAIYWYRKSSNKNYKKASDKLKILLKGKPKNFLTEQEKWEYYLAKYKNNPNEKIDSSGFTDLMNAIEELDYSKVKELMKNGANINHYTIDGRTPLGRAIVSKDLKMLKLILSYKPDLNIVTSNLIYEPIIIALNNGDTEYKMVEILIDAGADINIIDYKENNLLHECVRLNLYDLAKKLLEANIEIHIKNKFGETPLKQAYDKNDEKMIALLEKYSLKNISIYEKSNTLKDIEKAELLCNEYQQIKQFDNAILWCKKSIEFGNNEAIFELGKSYFNNKDFNNALLNFKKYYEQSNDNESIKNIASCFVELKNYEEAEKWYKKAIENNVLTSYYDTIIFYHKYMKDDVKASAYAIASIKAYYIEEDVLNLLIHDLGISKDIIIEGFALQLNSPEFPIKYKGMLYLRSY